MNVEDNAEGKRLNAKELLAQLLRDDAGNVSSMRAVMLFAMFVVLCTWAIICLWHGALVDLPEDISFLLFGLSGLKITQRKIAESISTQSESGNQEIRKNTPL